MAADDVRDALLDHAHVAECIVSEMATTYGGAWRTAFVVTVDDVESDVAALVDHVRQVLPNHRQPDDIHVVDRLPEDPDAAAQARAAEGDPES